MRRLLDVIQETNQVIASEDEPLDLTRLFPMLKSYEWLDGILLVFTDLPAWRSFVTTDLVVALAEDLPSFLSRIRFKEFRDEFMERMPRS